MWEKNHNISIGKVKLPEDSDYSNVRKCDRWFTRRGNSPLFSFKNKYIKRVTHIFLHLNRHLNRVRIGRKLYLTDFYDSAIDDLELEEFGCMCWSCDEHA